MRRKLLSVRWKLKRVERVQEERTASLITSLAQRQMSMMNRRAPNAGDESEWSMVCRGKIRDTSPQNRNPMPAMSL